MKLENKNIVVEGSCYLYIFKNKIRDKIVFLFNER